MPCFRNPPGRGGWVKKFLKAVTAGYMCFVLLSCALNQCGAVLLFKARLAEENTVEHLKETGHNKRSLLKLA